MITGLTNGTASTEALRAMMQDYWISFAVTLNPNDGKGNKRKSENIERKGRVVFIASFQVLNGRNTLSPSR